MTTPDKLRPGLEGRQVCGILDEWMQGRDFSRSGEMLAAVVPFLGQNLLAENIIEYSPEPGKDMISGRYYVLYEPLVRAKCALLVDQIGGMNALKDTSSLDVIVDRLVWMVNSETSEVIERIFALLALGQIIKAHSQFVPKVAVIAQAASLLVSQAAGAPQAFGLFHEQPFRYEVFCSFMYLADAALRDPQQAQAMVGANVAGALTAIGFLAPIYCDKHPEYEWLLLRLTARLLTEHPMGPKLFEIDRMPSGVNVPEVIRLLRWSVQLRGATDLRQWRRDVDEAAERFEKSEVKDRRFIAMLCENKLKGK